MRRTSPTAPTFPSHVPKESRHAVGLLLQAFPGSEIYTTIRRLPTKTERQRKRSVGTLAYYEEPTE